MTKKVQLIFPRADSTYDGIVAPWLVSAPIGLEILAKTVDDNVKDAKVEVFDGNLIPADKIAKRIKGDVVGASCWYSNVRNCVDFLKIAKERGATTVIGGPNATQLRERLLNNFSFIDYVVAGDGEDSLHRIVSGQDVKEIPNLVYRPGIGIIENPRFNHKPSVIFDLSHSVKSDYSHDNPFPIASIKGCVNAEQRGRCSFCAMDQKLMMMNPQLFWEQIDVITANYGYTYFQETGDCFIVGNYPQRLLDARPKGVLESTSFRIFASPDQVTEESADLLKRLNVKEVFIGTEHVNDGILARMGKKHRVRDIDRALGLLDSHGIGVHISFMYGLPGETRESMKENFEYAQNAVERYPKINLYAGVPIPVIGSKLFEDLANKPYILDEYEQDHRLSVHMDKDVFLDYAWITERAVREFSSVDYDHAKMYVEQTKRLTGRTVNSFGFNK